LSSTSHAFLALAGLVDHAGGAQLLCGSIVAYRRERLEAVGGFAALENFLGEDFEVARRFHERGWTVPTVALAAPNFDAGRTLGAVLRRFARWAVVTRQQRPHLYSTYFLFLGCAPLILMLTTLVAVAAPPFWWVGIAMAAIFFASRLALAIELRRAAGLRTDPLRSFAAYFCGEMIILAGAAGALGAPVVVWRGHRYRVGTGGQMTLVEK
jgi:ceramide glucosyltransferase